VQKIKKGDIFIARKELIGIYCFSCHPSSKFDQFYNINTIQLNKICIYTGKYWYGSCVWVLLDANKVKFIKIIYNEMLCWTNAEWLEKIL